MRDKLSIELVARADNTVREILHECNIHTEGNDAVVALDTFTGIRMKITNCLTTGNDAYITSMNKICT